MSATIETELEEVLAGLGPEEQKEVLEYARSLLNADGDDDCGAAEGGMLHFLSSISRDDLRRMREALREDGLAGVILVRFVGFVPEEELQRMRETPAEDTAAEPAAEAAETVEAAA